MKNFFKSNILVWFYFLVAVIIELTAVFVTSGKLYIRAPQIFLLLQLIIMLILLSIKTNKARHITSYLILIAYMVVDLVFIVIFEMTETVFDYGMFNLRNDGMAILESVPINFAYFSISMLAIALYIVFGGRYARHAESPVSISWTALPSVIVCAVGLVTVLYVNNKGFEENVSNKLYRSSETSYSEYGVVGNFLNEFVKGQFFTKVNLGDEQQLEDFIYDTSNIYASNFEDKEYNIVTILVESLEWHAFTQDFDLFVNGRNIDYTKYVDENGNAYTSAEQILRELYPNIYNFYDSSMVMTNFYSREKTDISENLSFLGSYPTNAYINYDFGSNNIANSMANVLKVLDEDITCNSFHNGSYTYYNRNEELISAGFDSFTATEQMKDLGMTDYSAKGERNLDTDMIEVCADKMFPTDKRFYTYITTITMHGQYTYRNNLDERGYYDALNKFGLTEMKGESEDVFNHNNFYYYCACVMEFDRALGKIMTELEERGLKDNTIVCLFGDHNTYYSSLSNYVKGIYSTSDENYTNLFRVPCMIYTPNVVDVVNYLNSSKNEEIGKRYIINTTDKGTQIIVKKFMCTADIVPTLFDLAGINNYGNLYFGHSVLSDEVSVLYSRAYDMFITDSIYFVSLNNIKYIRKDNPMLNNDPALKYADISNYDSEDHINAVELEAQKLLQKLSVCNRIFYNDYFARKNINDASKTNAQIFAEKLGEIN